MQCRRAIRRAHVLIAPLLVLFLLIGATYSWAAGSPRPMRFVFDARYTVPPGEDVALGRQAALDMAFAGVREKAARVLEQRSIIKKHALTTDDLEQCLAAYFPPTVDRLKEIDLGDRKVFSVRGILVVQLEEFKEAIRLWATYKLKGETPPPRIKKEPPPPPIANATANGTMQEQAANATEKPGPEDPLDLPATPEDFGTGASLPSLGSGSALAQAPAAQQPMEYLTSRDLLVQVFNLWDANMFTDPEQALELARLALIRQPTSHVALNNMGVAYHSIGEYEQAMDAYTQAIELKKDFVEAYHNRAQMHYLRGEYDLAIKDYSKVLRINSEYINARTHRALAYGKTGNAGLMCRDLETACRIGDCSFFEAAQRLGDCP